MENIASDWIKILEICKKLSLQGFFPMGKIAEKAVCRSVFNMALYFECSINQNALLQTVFWVL